jgi:F-type H+-transporting ATPase subunit b
MSLLLAESGVLQLSPGLVFWTILTFVLGGYVLRRMTSRPAGTDVEEAKHAVQDHRAGGKDVRSEAEKRLAEHKAAIAAMRAEAFDSPRQKAEDVERRRTERAGKRSDTRPRTPSHPLGE